MRVDRRDRPGPRASTSSPRASRRRRSWPRCAASAAASPRASCISRPMPLAELAALLADGAGAAAGPAWSAPADRRPPAAGGRRPAAGRAVPRRRPCSARRARPLGAARNCSAPRGTRGTGPAVLALATLAVGAWSLRHSRRLDPVAADDVARVRRDRRAPGPGPADPRARRRRGEPVRGRACPTCRSRRPAGRGARLRPAGRGPPAGAIRAPGRVLDAASR